MADIIKKLATEQAVNVKAGKNGTIPPVSKRFGQPGGNKRNNGGVPKYVREIRSEIKNLLDPNISIAGYRVIVANAETDSGLLALFASAIIKKEYKIVLALMTQAYGQPVQVVALEDKRDGPTDEEIDRRISEALDEPKNNKTAISNNTKQ